ncbi:hypothetical protein [Methylobacterium sp. J-070]|uniref:hypothetical protein n=1 Tax=Methylobacterium sp. J-070 TaxID=2836650 RepID=UPI001FB92C68|nr:hypothetical protein [Methylobacterium sp. J-070]MCJ2053492.1 hypothetical protein [Methylobacterium sp. J-070]
MRSGRRFTLPIDPWPQASLAERTAVGMVLTFLLLIPFCAAGAALFVITTLTAYLQWSYDRGASLRALIERRIWAPMTRHRRLVRKA